MPAHLPHVLGGFYLKKFYEICCHSGRLPDYLPYCFIKWTFCNGFVAKLVCRTVAEEGNCRLR